MNDFGYIDGIAQEAWIDDLSEDQSNAISLAEQFVNHDSRKHLVFGGVAGSGKSTIIPHIVELCGGVVASPDNCFEGDVAVCAYTGKAVMNLKRKGMPYACTLHSFLYDTRFVEDKVTGGTQIVHYPKPSCLYRRVKLLVVDEASMVSKEIFDLLESLPFKTLYVGDHFQLPPVNDNFNIMLNPDFKLERIHRQEEGNPIIMLADMARHGNPMPLGVYGSSKVTRTFHSSDLQNYDEVITWTNAVKDRANEVVRQLRGFQKDVPQIDDKMIVRVNCKPKNVYNGQIVYLMNNPTLRAGGGWNVEFVDELAYNDPFIMAQTDATTKAIASVHLPKSDLEKFRAMKQNVKSKSDFYNFKKENPYQIHLDWGYAITCHSAQGTSWKNVAILLEDRMRWVMDRNEMNRWIYTAITRAEESVTIYEGNFRNL